MSIKPYLLAQYLLHPTMQAPDVVKLCYQAARGTEHLLLDTARARETLEQELCRVEAADISLYEEISRDVCRVNLAAWKHRGLSVDPLFEAFVKSAQVTDNGEALLQAYLEEATELVETGNFLPDAVRWHSFLADYKQAGMPSIHHSEAYRDRERPAYRIVRRRLLNELPV